jgi:hypothetical protein
MTFSVIVPLLPDGSTPRLKSRVRLTYPSSSQAFMPERSKGLDSSSSIFVCVGSNPTECNLFAFASFHMTISIGVPWKNGFWRFSGIYRTFFEEMFHHARVSIVVGVAYSFMYMVIVGIQDLESLVPRRRSRRSRRNQRTIQDLNSRKRWKNRKAK